MHSLYRNEEKSTRVPLLSVKHVKGECDKSESLHMFPSDKKVMIFIDFDDMLCEDI